MVWFGNSERLHFFAISMAESPIGYPVPSPPPHRHLLIICGGVIWLSVMDPSSHRAATATEYFVRATGLPVACLAVVAQVALLRTVL
jgi:hypothetical protein